MSPCGFVARRSVDGGVFAPSRRFDAATDLHGDTRRAGRESAGTALLDWSIALLWPALAPCPAIFPASVTTTQFIGPDPNPPAGRSRPAAARTSADLFRSLGNNPDRKSTRLNSSH